VGLLQPELVEKVEVIEREVENVVEVLDALPGAESGMRRRIHGETLRQITEKRGPRHRTPGTMQEDQRWALAGALDDGAELAAPDRYRDAL
jgi:hypothetical protein